MVLPEFDPIERVCIVSGNVHPFGQILSVAGFVLVAGLSELVFSSTIVPAEAKV